MVLAREDMAERYPKRFGKYVLLKPLARGGMGEIYVAAAGEVGGFEKLCVIKKVLTEKTDRAKANRFLDEAKVVLRLSHANLVLTFDAGDVDGEFYIAMELIEGKDLREIWNRCVRTRTRIPLDVALHIVRELARALSYVHSYGELHLVHRDVAPPNILLSYFGEVKLTDFGLARSVLKQEHTSPGVVFGRASYLAPEQARGEVADARTDIYSLGIVLWELLTGQQYFQLANVDPVTALSMVRHPKPLPPSMRAPWITPELDAIAMRALAPNRNLRFQSADEMRLALSEAIAHVAPRADAERAADFLRGLYGSIIREEHDERERLLKARISVLHGEIEPSADLTPTPRDRPNPATPQPSAATAAPLPVAEGEEPTKVWRTATSSGTGPTSTPVPNGPPPSFIGRVIDGRYRILRQIGEGGMGTVYAGEHVGIGKGVAVKILHPVFSRQQDLVERFRREARAASRIGHPNIIDVTDFGTTEEGCAYFAMEHLDGIDLADVLSLERRIEPERAVQIAIQICRALHAAHAAGVIHRDLKPENIFLVSRDGQADFVKVLDFGIARSLNRNSRRLTNPGMAMGTPEYMAPEQATGEPADRRSDIYSVGALLYEMLLGSPPHLGGVQPDGAAGASPSPSVLRRPREILPTLPDDLDDIILRSLHRDPSQRYQTMAQLEYELTKSLWGRPRAVADLLGFRDPARTETPSGSFRRNFALDSSPEEGGGDPNALGVPPLPTPMTGALVGLARLAGTIDVSAARTSTLMGRSPTPTPPPLVVVPRGLVPAGAGGALDLTAPRAAPVVSPASGMRVVATMAVLAVVGIVSAVAYQRIPWLRGQPAAPSSVAITAATATTSTTPASAPVAKTNAAGERTARVAALTSQASALVRRPTFGAADVPALQATLAALAQDGAQPAADELARAAATGLEARSAAAVAAGKREEAVVLFELARTVDGAAANAEAFARSLRQRGEAALGAGQAAEAADWARESLRFAAADADGQALLGLSLAGARDWANAVVPLQKALALRPGDTTVKRALSRVRAHLPGATTAAGDEARRPRRRAVAPRPVAPGDDLNNPQPVQSGEDLPLAPGQPAAEKQQ
ncbi:MAG TPA: protein kinase [Polyangia bacterium]|nr:protein kinase [Polyangia bacterium]